MNRFHSVCIINRNYPPLVGATGYHAHQLAQYLRSLNIEVHIVTAATEENQVTNDKIHFIRPFYNGTAKKLRLLGSFIEASRLVSKALELNANFYIVMTDPALLNYVASKKMKGRRWALWTMDLFPDGFVANSLVSKRNRLCKLYQHQLRKNAPELLITLGRQQKQFLQENYFPETPAIDWPIGFRTIEDLEEDESQIEAPSWASSDKIVIAYIGNLGEAHNPDVLGWIADTINPEHHILVLSCRGTHKKNIEDSLCFLDHVHIESHIPEKFMHNIDIHIVILRPEWTHICVPSKAITAIQHRGTVLFFGSRESDTWRYTEPCGWQVSSRIEIKQWADTLTSEKMRLKKESVSTLYQKLEAEKSNGWNSLSSYIKKEISS